MKRKNDKLELILLGVGILLLLLLFVVKRRLDAPEETSPSAESDMKGAGPDQEELEEVSEEIPEKTEIGA